MIATRNAVCFDFRRADDSSVANGVCLSGDRLAKSEHETIVSEAFLDQALNCLTNKLLRISIEHFRGVSRDYSNHFNMNGASETAPRARSESVPHEAG